MIEVVLSFKGKCQGGPWDGQRVDAEKPYVLAAGGEYRWRKAIWLWWDQPEPITTDGQGALK